MIKRAFFLGLLGLSLGREAHATEWPVADAALKTCLAELAAKYGWTDPTQFLEITCHNRGIGSIDGLDAFVNVGSLSFYKNKIQTVLLKGLPRLHQLNLAQNEVHKLQLNELPALTKLFFFDNRLNTLELADLPALEEFKGNHNGMKSFTYTNLPRLKKIYLFDNLLETIDIHRLPALQYMDVRENPMPDDLYEAMDALTGITFLHDGNAEDW